ncbi:hypothetical protein [Methanosarcina barkeri]|uniref:hypothetical protein n=1 Tax=Methanosarcina barkeri TaxID=2208 RepID=UPI0012D37533|nr:hypothetical protein [Methanosarcina barkeri]
MYGIEDIDRCTTKISSLSQLKQKSEGELKDAENTMTELNNLKIKAMSLEDEKTITSLEEQVTICEGLITAWKHNLDDLRVEIDKLSKDRDNAINRTEIDSKLPDLKHKIKELSDSRLDYQNEFNDIVNSKGN